MIYLLKNAKVFFGGEFILNDVLVSDGVIVSVKEDIECEDAEVFDLSGAFIFPGFTDVHVHFREPGFSYKETIASGSRAGARGGYTTVCTMPNLSPVPDCVESIRIQQDIIERDAVIDVLPYGAITVGEHGEELSDLDGLCEYAVAFSDDGRGVQNEEMMLSAMKKCRQLNKIIAAHCEDNSLLFGGYVHDGEYAKEHGHKGICSKSEYGPIERDVELSERTGCSYHVCHISAKESVEVIRRAKARGVDVTCETAPHYLVLDDSCLLEDGRFKMNPPLRDKSDREALVKGVIDGTIDMIATDHAPHSIDEKSRGLRDSAMGIVGLETAFPILYTKLVRTGVLSLEKLITLMSVNPNKRFKIGSELKVGNKAQLTVFDLNSEYTIDPEDFLTHGRATPFKGERVFGKCLLTINGDRIAYRA